MSLFAACMSESYVAPSICTHNAYLCLPSMTLAPNDTATDAGAVYTMDTSFDTSTYADCTVTETVGQYLKFNVTSLVTRPCYYGYNITNPVGHQPTGAPNGPTNHAPHSLTTTTGLDKISVRPGQQTQPAEQTAQPNKISDAAPLISTPLSTVGPTPTTAPTNPLSSISAVGNAPVPSSLNNVAAQGSQFAASLQAQVSVFTSSSAVNNPQPAVGASSIPQINDANPGNIGSPNNPGAVSKESPVDVQSQALPQTGAAVHPKSTQAGSSVGGAQTPAGQAANGVTQIPPSSGQSVAVNHQNAAPITETVLPVPVGGNTAGSSAASPSQPAPTLVIGSQTYTADISSNFVIGAQTLAPGAPAIVIPSGPVVSLGSSHAVFAPSTQAIQPAQASVLPPIVIAGSTIGPNAQSQYIVGSQTLKPGEPAITEAGHTISLAPSASALVVDSSTTNLIPAPVVTIAGSAVTANSASQFEVNGQTLSPGGVITVAGQQISLAPSGNAIVYGDSTQAIYAPSSIAGAAPQTITVGNSVITQNSVSAFVIAGQTLRPGSAITVSGTPIFLAPSASAVVVGGITQALGVPPTQALQIPQPVTIGSSVYTANSASQYIIGGQTLSPGSAITVSGTPISLVPSASAVVIAGVTQALMASSVLTTPTLPLLTIGSSVYTANSASQYVIGSQTLSPGSVITLSGTPISLAPSATALVIAGITKSLSQPSNSITTAPPLITIGSSVYTANSASQYIVGGQTLSPNSAVTINGVTISLASNTGLVIGTSTIPLHSQTISLTTTLPILTIGSAIVTSDASGNYIYKSHTIVPGAPAQTIDGTTISLAPSELLLVIGSSTEHPKPRTETQTLESGFQTSTTQAGSTGTSSGLGGAISSPFGTRGSDGKRVIGDMLYVVMGLGMAVWSL